MPKGIVKEYDRDRGYGVIVDSSSGEKLTVYANYVDLKENETLNRGQDVEYDIESQRIGNWAINVRILPTPH